MSSKFTNSQPTIEVKVNSPTANVGITDAEYNISLNPDVEANIFATKTELSAVENKIPAEYVKSAAVVDNKLTLTKQDNTVVEFEGGGGGNGYESYTAAWYMGSRHCKLDCWKKGKKGLIITLGDEPLNPILEKYGLSKATGDSLQADVKTKELYDETAEKYDIFHISIKDPSSSYDYRARRIDESFEKVLPFGHYKVATLDQLPNLITAIVEGHYNDFDVVVDEKPVDEGIAWTNW